MKDKGMKVQARDIYEHYRGRMNAVGRQKNHGWPFSKEGVKFIREVYVNPKISQALLSWQNTYVFEKIKSWFTMQ